MSLVQRIYPVPDDACTNDAWTSAEGYSVETRDRDDGSAELLVAIPRRHFHYHILRNLKDQRDPEITIRDQSEIASVHRDKAGTVLVWPIDPMNWQAVTDLVWRISRDLARFRTYQIPPPDQTRGPHPQPAEVHVPLQFWTYHNPEVASDQTREPPRSDLIHTLEDMDVGQFITGGRSISTRPIPWIFLGNERPREVNRFGFVPRGPTWHLARNAVGGSSENDGTLVIPSQHQPSGTCRTSRLHMHPLRLILMSANHDIQCGCSIYDETEMCPGHPEAFQERIGAVNHMLRQRLGLMPATRAQNMVLTTPLGSDPLRARTVITADAPVRPDQDGNSVLPPAQMRRSIARAAAERARAARAARREVANGPAPSQRRRFDRR
jgi:hypothetical protein